MDQVVHFLPLFRCQCYWSVVTRLIRKLSPVEFLKVLFSVPFCSLFAPSNSKNSFHHYLLILTKVTLTIHNCSCFSTLIRNAIFQTSAWMTTSLLCLALPKQNSSLLEFHDQSNK